MKTANVANVVPELGCEKLHREGRKSEVYLFGLCSFVLISFKYSKNMRIFKVMWLWQGGRIIGSVSSPRRQKKS